MEDRADSVTNIKIVDVFKLLNNATLDSVGWKLGTSILGETTRLHLDNNKNYPLLDNKYPKLFWLYRSSQSQQVNYKYRHNQQQIPYWAHSILERNRKRYIFYSNA